MIEAANIGGSVGPYRAALGINHYIKRLNADLAQHRTKQGCLVFAVAVMVSENFRGRMGLKASNPKFDGDISDVVLHKLRQRSHLIHRSIGRSGESGDSLPDLG